MPCFFPQIPRTLQPNHLSMRNGKCSHVNRLLSMDPCVWCASAAERGWVPQGSNFTTNCILSLKY